MMSGQHCEFPSSKKPLRFGPSVQIANLQFSALDTRNPVVIKHAPPDRLHKEIQALRLCKGSPYIRQLVDTTDSPPSMVLERLDTSLYAASCQQPLEKGEIKQIIKSVLHGLIVLHGFGRIHNG